MATPSRVTPARARAAARAPARATARAGRGPNPISMNKTRAGRGRGFSEGFAGFWKGFGGVWRAAVAAPPKRHTGTGSPDQLLQRIRYIRLWGRIGRQRPWSQPTFVGHLDSVAGILLQATSAAIVRMIPCASPRVARRRRAQRGARTLGEAVQCSPMQSYSKGQVGVL